MLGIILKDKFHPGAIPYPYVWITLELLMFFGVLALSEYFYRRNRRKEKPFKMPESNVFMELEEF